MSENNSSGCDFVLAVSQLARKYQPVSLRNPEKRPFLCQFALQMAGLHLPRQSTVYEFNSEDNVTVGDVNNNGDINIIDAQITFDMSNGKWTETSLYDKLISELKNTGTVWDTYKLSKAADANCDSVINSEDSRAIQYYTHNGYFKVA